MNAPFTVYGRPHGDTCHNVLRYGASADGVGACSEAFQRAIDTFPDDGGLLVVPPGTFLMDPRTPIRLRSRVKVMIDEKATLVLAPSDLPRTQIFLIPDGAEDVTIEGGTLAGDKETHRYGGATTHEWGHGVAIYGGRRVTLRNLRIQEFTGDGISIGHSAEDVVVSSVQCRFNRRQGLTIGRSSGVYVADSHFTETGEDDPDGADMDRALAGTAPMAGIDIEPDAGGDAKGITITRCRMADNRGPGLLLMVRTSGVDPAQIPTISDVAVEDCVIEGNSNGIEARRAQRVRIRRNRILRNRASGIVIHDAFHGLIEDNAFSENYLKNQGAPSTRDPFEAWGTAKAWERDLLVKSTSPNAYVGPNRYEA